MRLFILISIIFFSFSGTLKAEQYTVCLTSEIMIDGHPVKKKKLFKKVCEKLGIDISKSENMLLHPNKRSAQGLRKGRAILMAVLTGPLGGHRLYLGTQTHVPIVYTLTLGGGMGLLPLIDVFVILFTTDLSQYKDCGQIIMWGN